MHMNSTPIAEEFFNAAKEAFSFMPEEVRSEEKSTYYDIKFRSKSIAISVSYDIRDQEVDCSIDELWDASDKSQKVNLPQYCSLFGYLVKNRGYRGSFKEFRNNESSHPRWFIDLNAMAGAVAHFFPIEVANE